MKRKVINLNSLEKVLSPQEMKSLKGGSSGICCQGGECSLEFLCSDDGICIWAWGEGAHCV